MTLPFLREFKLAGEDGDGCWPYLNDDGAFLEEGVALLERDAQGLWRTRSHEALQRLLEAGYGDGIDAGRRIDALTSVARALNAGDKARAAMTLVHAGLPALDDPERARKLAAADALLKYSPDQPRVPAGNRDGGQWSGGCGSAGQGHTAPGHRIDPTFAKKQRFVAAHLADAQKAADRLRIPVENVLGLSSLESQWGESRAAVLANNYFGIHYPAPYAIDSLPVLRGPVKFAVFASYADNLRSFETFSGHLIEGVADPAEFARIPQDSGKFGINNNGTKVPDYVQSTSSTIRSLRSFTGH